MEEMLFEETQTYSRIASGTKYRFKGWRQPIHLNPTDDPADLYFYHYKVHWNIGKAMYCWEAFDGEKTFEVHFDDEFVEGGLTFEEALHYDFSGMLTYEQEEENKTLKAVVELMCM